MAVRSRADASKHPPEAERRLWLVNRLRVVLRPEVAGACKCGAGPREEEQISRLDWG